MTSDTRIRVETLRPTKSTIQPGRTWLENGIRFTMQSYSFCLTSSIDRFTSISQFFAANNLQHKLIYNNISTMSSSSDNRPSLVSLDQLSRSARSLTASTRSLDARSSHTSKDEATSTPVNARRARRLPPRAVTINTSTLGDSSSDPTSMFSPGRRRMMPKRSISQRFDRRVVLAADLDESDN